MCGSYERHRLTWLFLTERTDLFDGRARRLLHVAPERSLGARLAAIPNLEYVSADIADAHAMLRLDVTDIALPDRCFDVILCSHVLEHVADDARALRELARILRDDGWAVLEVPPLRGDTTFEDPTVTEPRERARVFGQRDHVRVVGRDYPDRIRANGWIVERHAAEAVANGRDLRELGLLADEEVFLCRPSGLR
jgi:SAM-dependent methyltransferase